MVEPSGQRSGIYYGTIYEDYGAVKYRIYVYIKSISQITALHVIIISIYVYINPNIYELNRLRLTVTKDGTVKP